MSGTQSHEAGRQAAALERVEHLISLGRADQALEVLGPLLAASPGDVRPLLLAAAAHRAADRPGLQATWARRALAVDPSSEWGWRLLSDGLRQQGFSHEAVDAASHAVSLAPNLWMSHAQLALSYAGCRGSQAQGWDAARRAVELAPNEADTHFTVGVVAMATNDRKVARTAFERALALEPGHAGALNELGRLFVRQRKFVGALSGFAGAARVDPGGVGAGNVRVVLANLLRWGHWVVIATCVVVYVLAAQASDRQGGAALMLRLVGSALPLLLVSGVVTRLRAALAHGTARVVGAWLRADRLAAAWLVLLLVCLGVFVAVPWLSPDARFTAAGAVRLTLFAAVGISWIRASRQRRETGG